MMDAYGLKVPLDFLQRSFGEQLPDCEVKIYFIDRRTPGRNEEMLTKKRIQI